MSIIMLGLAIPIIAFALVIFLGSKADDEYPGYW